MPPHYGSGNGLNQCGSFPNESQQDGKDSSTADDSDAVHFCYRHNAYVFAVSGGGHGTEQGGEGG